MRSLRLATCVLLSCCREVVKRLIQTIILAVTIPFGVKAVAWGISAMALVEWMLNAATAMRYVSCNIVALLRRIAPSMILAAVMFVAVRISQPYFASLHVALRLLLGVLVAGVTYLGGAWLCRINALGEALVLLRATLTKSEH